MTHFLGHTLIDSEHYKGAIFLEFYGGGMIGVTTKINSILIINSFFFKFFKTKYGVFFFFLLEVFFICFSQNGSRKFPSFLNY